MSHCEPEWVSDDHFTNALRFRLLDEEPQLLASVAPPEERESLLRRGGTDPDGQPFLSPAVVVNVPAALPDAAGEHDTTGRTAGGDELFSLDFAMPGLADSDGNSFFVFVLPVEPPRADSLANDTLSGSGGSTTLDSETDIPMTILFNPSTGQARGILRDMPQADAAAVASPRRS